MKAASLGRHRNQAYRRDWYIHLMHGREKLRKTLNTRLSRLFDAIKKIKPVELCKEKSYGQ